MTRGAGGHNYDVRRPWSTSHSARLHATLRNRRTERETVEMVPWDFGALPPAKARCE